MNSASSQYTSDQKFLAADVYPKMRGSITQHDSYSCHLEILKGGYRQHPGAKAFPTKRSKNYQHVGQVFDGDVTYGRLVDIDCCMVEVPVNEQCRLHKNWTYG